MRVCFVAGWLRRPWTSYPLYIAITEVPDVLPVYPDDTITELIFREIKKNSVNVKKYSIALFKR